MESVYEVSLDIEVKVDFMLNLGFILQFIVLVKVFLETFIYCVGFLLYFGFISILLLKFYFISYRNFVMQFKWKWIKFSQAISFL